MKTTPTPTGAFFTIESTEPAIRSEQFKRLADRLKNEGHDVVCVSFPQYESTSSHFAKQYQSGAYGELTDVGPYTSSVFYALDRYEAAQAIREALAAGKVVLANRYCGSNMAQQGMKFISSEQRRGYFIWLDNLEFEMLRIPRPERSFILRLPADLSESTDYEQQKLLVQVYDEMAMLFPKDFIRIDCARDGKRVDEASIHHLLYYAIEPLLPGAKGVGTIEKLASTTEVETKPKESTHTHLVTGLERMELAPSISMPEQTDRFYIPALKGALKEQYVTTLSSVFETYDKLLAQLPEKDKQYAAALLPLATFYESSDPVKPGRYVNKALKQFALSELQSTLDGETKPVSLTSFMPRNELDLVADVLYQYTTSSYQVVKSQLSTLSYAQKEKVLAAYLQQATQDEVVVDAHYTFDLVIDHTVYDTLRSIQPAIKFDWQGLSARYGFDIPGAVEASGYGDAYEQCFDDILALHSELSAAGLSDAATLALLRGHRFRCRFVIDLPALQALLKVMMLSHDVTVRKTAHMMREAVGEAHPLTAEFI